MSLRGTLRRVLPLKGELTEQTPKLRGTLAPKDRLQGALTPKGGFSGVLARMDKSLGATARKLAVFYRFIAARDRILAKRKAKANAVPTAGINADTAIRANLEAPGKAQPALEVTVDSKAYASVVARLVAYIRAPLQYVKGIAVKSEVGPVAAPGAIGKYIKAVTMGRASKAVKAPGAIVESRYNVQDVGAGADADTAPGVTAPAFDEVQNVGLTASAGAASGQTLSVEPVVAVAVHAGLAFWFEPYYENGILVIRQVYAATQDGETLEVT